VDEEFDDLLDELWLKLEEECIQMMLEEVQTDSKGFLVHFFIAHELLIILDSNRLDNKFGKDAENIVIVALTDGEVHIVASYHVVEQLANDLKMDPLLFVFIVDDLFRLEAVPEGQELNNILGSFFEHSKSIDVPGIKADS